ncbi:hypothetical protein [Corynebacterium uterequi]|uniref:hypothetical protein n=1 Tax=Corynebacterium uterequi TaxID=1072256 RepID=UPI0011874A1C|nr:hypothetical protein [Corynebacterium uterequi]
MLVIDCVGAPEHRPTTLSADCSSPTVQLTDIVWDSWDDEQAEGTGTLQGKEVTVVLSVPVDNGSELVFSTVMIDGQVVSS